MSRPENYSRRILVPRPLRFPTEDPQDLLETPISPARLYALLDDLRVKSVIGPLSHALEEKCSQAGWQTAIQERIMQVLHAGEVGTRGELERLIIREALGSENSGEQKYQGRKQADVTSGPSAVNSIPSEAGSHELKSSETDLSNPSPSSKPVPILLPVSATTEGHKIVREAIEGFVDLEPEPEPLPVWSLE